MLKITRNGTLQLKKIQNYRKFHANAQKCASAQSTVSFIKQLIVTIIWSVF